MENGWVGVDEGNLLGTIIVRNQGGVGAVELHQRLDHNKL
jgi:hypothetical protein